MRGGVQGTGRGLPHHISIIISVTGPGVGVTVFSCSFPDVFCKNCVRVGPVLRGRNHHKSSTQPSINHSNEQAVHSNHNNRND